MFIYRCSTAKRKDLLSITRRTKQKVIYYTVMRKISLGFLNISYCLQISLFVTEDKHR